MTDLTAENLKANLWPRTPYVKNQVPISHSFWGHRPAQAEETEDLLGGATLSVPPNTREGRELRAGVTWCHPAGLSGTGLFCTTVVAMPGSTYVLAAESAFLQIINNSYVAVDKFLHIFFTIHANYCLVWLKVNNAVVLSGDQRLKVWLQVWDLRVIVGLC